VNLIEYLKQECSVSVPNKVWLADITCLSIGEGWLYLSTVLDLATRKVIGPPQSPDCDLFGHGSAVLLTADGRCATICGPS
jgi:transposase InsO family protein